MNNATKGFASHPELINRGGRPKKGQTMTDIMQDYLEDREEGHEISRKEEFVRRVAALAYHGNFRAIKLIWNYIDGMPKQKIQLEDARQTLEDINRALDERFGGKDETA